MKEETECDRLLVEEVATGTTKFQLTKEQNEKYKEWSKHCKTYGGTIGGRHTFSFTPCGLGMMVVVSCMCGKEIDLTDTSGW